MKILMMTNTYKPLLGGLEKSVEIFTRELRKRGHRVIIATPQCEGAEPEEDVIRIPAVQNFNGSDFSVQLPNPGVLIEALGDLRPDVIHAHHPFLIGDTALRASSKYNAPLVFTHHTLYEENVHYVPGNEEALKRFVIELSTGYANLADKVIAPSESVMRLMQERGVQTSIDVVPTGIDVKNFLRGAKAAFRKKFNIPADAFVVGHLGRLALEKNLEFLARAVLDFLKTAPKGHFVVAGKGPSEDLIQQIFAEANMSDRLHLVGIVRDRELVAAYHAMDVFAFASQSETQGLVLTEAMAAGVPIVAVDAPGVREVVQDEKNGRLLEKENIEDFVAALQWIHKQTPAKLKEIKAFCRETAKSFSIEKSVDKLCALYVSLVVREGFIRRGNDESSWAVTMRLIQTQWDLVKNLTKATGAMMRKDEPREEIAAVELASI